MLGLNSTKLTITAASFFALAASASASDLGIDGRADQYEPAPAQARTYFQGIAVGIDGGGQFNATQLNGELDEDDANYDFNGDLDQSDVIPFALDGVSSDGLIGGAHLEYLFAVDRFRFGAYGEGGFSNVNTDVKFGDASGDLLKQDSYYGAGLKAGFTTGGSTLFFARVGYDWSQWEAFEAVDADVGSWLIGGGIETMISENISLGLGADYLIVDDVEAAGADLSDIFDDSEMLRVKARLTWRQ